MVPITLTYSLVWLFSVIPPTLVQFYIFQPLVSAERNRQIKIFYTLTLILETLLLFWLFTSDHFTYSWLSLKKITYLYWLPFFFGGAYLVRPHTYQYIFAIGLQGMFIFAVHTLLMNLLVLYYSPLALRQNILYYYAVYIFAYSLFSPAIIHLFKKIFLDYKLAEHLRFWHYFSWLPLLLMLYSISLSVKDLPLGYVYFWPRLFQLLSALFLTVTFYLNVQKVRQNMKVQENNNTLQAHMEMLGDYIHMLQASQKRMSIFRHDTRHQLLLLSSLVEEKDEEAALSFIKDLQSDLSSIRTWQGSISPYLRTLLQPLWREARHNKISVTLDIDLPHLDPSFEKELGALLFILLKTAAAALQLMEEKDRSVSFIAHQTDTSVTLFIRNRYLLDLALDKRGLPITPPYNSVAEPFSDFCQKRQAVYQYSKEDGWLNIHLHIPYQRGNVP